jgi:hypothetical protein
VVVVGLGHGRVVPAIVSTERHLPVRRPALKRTEAAHACLYAVRDVAFETAREAHAPTLGTDGADDGAVVSVAVGGVY